MTALERTPLVEGAAWGLMTGQPVTIIDTASRRKAERQSARSRADRHSRRERQHRSNTDALLLISFLRLVE